MAINPSIMLKWQNTLSQGTQTPSSPRMAQSATIEQHEVLLCGRIKEKCSSGVMGGRVEPALSRLEAYEDTTDLLAGCQKQNEGDS